jgi:hypothetical protein
MPPWQSGANSRLEVSTGWETQINSCLPWVPAFVRRLSAYCLDGNNRHIVRQNRWEVML